MILKNLLVQYRVPPKKKEDNSQTGAITFWGALAGAIMGFISSIVTSFYGPLQLEKYRSKRLEEKYDTPRKKILKTMLEDDKFSDGRLFSTLQMTIGATEEDCRRLLIEVGARGIWLQDEQTEKVVEGWVLISKRPLSTQI